MYKYIRIYLSRSVLYDTYLLINTEVETSIRQYIHKYMCIYNKMLNMDKDETVEEDETKTTMKIPTVLLDEFKHLAIDEKTTVTALIVESMKQYLKYIKKK